MYKLSLHIICTRSFIKFSVPGGKYRTDFRYFRYLIVDIRYFYRQDAAKRPTAGIVFTHRPKIRFFAPQGRLVAPIQVNLCSTDGHRGPLGCAKFRVNWCRRVGMRPPKYQKFPLFGKESPRRGDSLDRFRKFLMGFYMSNYPTLVFQISCDSHHRLRSYCGETARR